MVMVVLLSMVVFVMEMVIVVMVNQIKLVVMVAMVMVATCKRRKKVSSLQKSKDSTAGKSFEGVEKVGKGGRTHLMFNRSALS